MARGRSTFRQRDVTAMVRALERAGKQVARVEWDHEGNVKVITGTPEEDPGSGVTTEEEWERFENERFKNVGKSQKRRASGEPKEP